MSMSAETHALLGPAGNFEFESLTAELRQLLEGSTMTDLPSRVLPESEVDGQEIMQMLRLSSVEESIAIPSAEQRKIVSRWDAVHGCRTSGSLQFSAASCSPLGKRPGHQARDAPGSPMRRKISAVQVCGSSCRVHSPVRDDVSNAPDAVGAEEMDNPIPPQISFKRFHIRSRRAMQHTFAPHGPTGCKGRTAGQALIVKNRMQKLHKGMPGIGDHWSTPKNTSIIGYGYVLVQPKRLSIIEVPIVSIEVLELAKEPAQRQINKRYWYEFGIRDVGLGILAHGERFNAELVAVEWTLVLAQRVRRGQQNLNSLHIHGQQQQQIGVSDEIVNVILEFYKGVMLPYILCARRGAEGSHVLFDMVRTDELVEAGRFLVMLLHDRRLNLQDAVPLPTLEGELPPTSYWEGWTSI